MDTNIFPPLSDEDYNQFVPPPRKCRWTVAELLDHTFPEPKWIVPGIFTEGLTMLAGRPKVGKSWLALQIATAVACGGKVFEQDITPGKVLYLALEDSGRRLKDRIEKLRIPRDAPINIIQETRPLHGKGYDDLAFEIEDGKYSICGRGHPHPCPAVRGSAEVRGQNRAVCDQVQQPGT